jgi:N-acetylneuraminic acid mutarotase
MQSNPFSNQTHLRSISIRLGLVLALGILVFLHPSGLVGGAAPSLAAVGWNALPNRGLDLRVRAGALMGDDLYLGGMFTKTGDGLVTDLGGVVRYDTASGAWHPLPNQGLNAETIALAVMDDDLYSGGCFTQTVDGALPNLGNIARYDIAGDSWQALPNQGLNDHVHALAAAGSNLYAGGRFTQSGDGSNPDLGHIARYDSVGDSWQALPNEGLAGNVYVLAVDGTSVYAGGGFYSTTDGGVTDLGHIARYDTVGDSWHALPNLGLNDTVTALHVSGNDLYVGGRFSQTGDGTVTSLGGIARLDTATGIWHALSNQGLNEQVFSIFEVDGSLYVGGAFDQTGDGSVTGLGYIARYDTASKTWHALPNQGFNSWVYTFTQVDSDLYVGGEFNQTGDQTVPSLGRIARLGEIGERLYLPLVIRQ